MNYNFNKHSYQNKFKQIPTCQLVQSQASVLNTAFYLLLQRNKLDLPAPTEVAEMCLDKTLCFGLPPLSCTAFSDAEMCVPTASAFALTHLDARPVLHT